MNQFGLRLILAGDVPAIGAALPTSWHPASECDWLTEDQELPGSCCFLMDDDSAESEERAWAWARCYWPEVTLAVVIKGRLVAASEYGGLPEDGAGVLANATVVRHAGQEVAQ